VGEAEASDWGKADQHRSQESQWTAWYERGRSQEVIDADEGAVGGPEKGRLAMPERGVPRDGT
jgi:hypothetical protein